MEQRNNSTLVNWSGAVRTATPDDLDFLTCAGWKVLEMYTEDVIEQVTDEEPNLQQPSPNNYNYPSLTVTTKRSHKCRYTRFLLGLDEKSTLFQKKTELQREKDLVQNLKVELEGATKALKEAKYALDLCERQRDSFKSAVNTFQERLDSSGKTVADEQEKSRKLEHDLAKVRQAVGDLRWREILGNS